VSAFRDLHGQIEAMLHRSDKYKAEAEAERDVIEAEKHARVSAVLRELDRLARAFAKHEQPTPPTP